MKVLTGRNSARLGAFAVACLSVAALASAPAMADTDTPTAAANSVAEQTDRLMRDSVPVRKDTQLPKLGISDKAFAERVAPRVIGGETVVNPKAYPWVVGVATTFDYDANGNGKLDFETDNNGNITYSEFRESICTGTILSPTKVLTAGNCIIGLPHATTRVVAGRTYLHLDTDGGAVVGVASTWTHPGYNYAQRNTQVPIDDVAVLTLQTPLPAAYTPIELSGAGDTTPYAPNTNALIIGYGYSSRTDPWAGILHKATVPVQSDATCSTAWGSRYNSTKAFCAGDPTVEPEGRGTCIGDSGGPVVVNGKQVGIIGWGSAVCGAQYSVHERISYYRNDIDRDVARNAAPNLDFTGDGHSDLLVRDSRGELLQYMGSGFVNDGRNGFTSTWRTGAPLSVATGFGSYTKVFRVNNWLGDNRPGVMAVDKKGNLFLYQLAEYGWFLEAPKRVGSSWNKFTDIMVTSNWFGNGRPNLMGRTASGDLIVYTSNGKGGWTNPAGSLIGSGWNSFDTVLTPGAWMGDGRQTLIGRTPAGDLRLYVNRANGSGWMNPKGLKIGSGWNSLPVFMSPGDFDGDNKVDLIGRTKSGDIRLYTTNGKGSWIDGRGRVIVRGWNSYNAIF